VSKEYENIVPTWAKRLYWRRWVEYVEEGQHPLTGQRAPPISGGT